MSRKRFRIEIFGRVQGVGFRQSTWNMAQKYQIAGWVRNSDDRHCVLVEAEGESEPLQQFLVWLRHGPASARVDRISHREIEIQGDRHFDIR